jgi:hypothetical protein
MRASTQHESDNVGTRLWVALTSSPAQNLAGWHLRHCRPLVSTIRMRGVPDITQMTLLPRRSNSIKRRLAYVRSIDPVSAMSTSPLSILGDSARYRQRYSPVLHRHSPSSGTRRATNSATRQSLDLDTWHARGFCDSAAAVTRRRLADLDSTPTRLLRARQCGPAVAHSPTTISS